MFFSREFVAHVPTPASVPSGVPHMKICQHDFSYSGLPMIAAR